MEMLITKIMSESTTEHKRCPHGVLIPHRCRDCEQDINEDDLIRFKREVLGITDEEQTKQE